jgi:hypothetical protein
MPVSLDRYARDAGSWRDFAKVNHVSAHHLFTSGNPFMYLVAATLGHHALEMYLKAALINEGMTVCNPKDVSRLDPALEIKPEDCVWGHSLPELAEKLAEKCKDFNLDEKVPDPRSSETSKAMTVREAFAMFDPYFWELRYPQEAPNVEGAGAEEAEILDTLVKRLKAFLKNV